MAVSVAGVSLTVVPLTCDDGDAQMPWRSGEINPKRVFTEMSLMKLAV